MPIYAYRCESCGYEKDVLRKVSDPLLTVCPVCHAETFRKQLTAAGFQLKGSGWYATDFRGGAKPKEAGESAGETAKTDAAPASDKSAEKTAAAAPAAPTESATKASPPAAATGS